MAKEKLNRDVMYRVLKLLWFTKDEFSFVALNEEVILVKFENIEDRTRILNLMPWLINQCLFVMLPLIKGQELDGYKFNIHPFWIRIFNIPLEQMNRQMAIDVGKAIGDVVAIGMKVKSFAPSSMTSYQFSTTYVALLEIPLRNATRKMNNTNNFSFQYRNWLRIQLGGSNQNKGNWRNRIEILDNQTNSKDVNKRSKEGTRDDNETTTQKGKKSLEMGKRTQHRAPPGETVN
ncbi:hypothetical protein Gotri_005971 [Gossypium trilobum]|uniref:DUF4283 domain-containing protein n=1 Tax=Gossypium trilobum TaxID=34281 RepID=A0A7J9EYF5_9ROSI|nr:hypothetical protein [Gossypium trilobum]